MTFFLSYVISQRTMKTSFLLSTFGLFPSTSALMSAQVVHASEYVDVHEQEIVGYKQPLVLFRAVLACILPMLPDRIESAASK